jgi:hypothetical protein
VLACSRERDDDGESHAGIHYLRTHFPLAHLLSHWNFGGLLIFRSCRHCARQPNTHLNPVAAVAGSGPNNAEETMMRRLIVAGTVLALAAGVTASAMASDQKADKSGSHVGRFHAAAFGGTHHTRHGSRLAGVRGPESRYPGGGSQGYHGGFIDLGPLGITAACGSYPHGYNHCGSSYGTPVDAWSY